jgi:TonB family protein
MSLVSDPNTSGSPTLSTTTDNTGRYMFQHIDAGTYDLTVTVPGFKHETQMGIHVAAGEAHNGGMMILMVGSVADSISVTASRSAALAAGPTVALLGPVTTLAPAAILDQSRADPDRAARSNYQALVGRLTQTVPGGPIRVGGNVQAANLINAVRPAYPAEMARNGVQGTVKFEAVVSKDGVLENLKVINSPDPVLTQAAMNAVQQWRYRPTMLNGEAIEVLTTIDVNFSLTD